MNEYELNGRFVFLRRHWSQSRQFKHLCSAVCSQEVLVKFESTTFRLASGFLTTRSHHNFSDEYVLVTFAPLPQSQIGYCFVQIVGARLKRDVVLQAIVISVADTDVATGHSDLRVMVVFGRQDQLQASVLY